jgi:hypothetical protein
MRHVGDQRAAMAVRRDGKGRSHVVAEQRYIGGVKAVADFQLAAGRSVFGKTERDRSAEAHIHKIDLILPAKVCHLAAEAPWTVQLQCSGRTGERDLATRTVGYFKRSAVGDGVWRGVDRRIGKQGTAVAVGGNLEIGERIAAAEVQLRWYGPGRPLS